MNPCHSLHLPAYILHTSFYIYYWWLLPSEYAPIIWTVRRTIKAVISPAPRMTLLHYLSSLSNRHFGTEAFSFQSTHCLYFISHCRCPEVSGQSFLLSSFRLLQTSKIRYTFATRSICARSSLSWSPPPSMCILVVERYAVCKCLYYRHNIDMCAAYGTRGHAVRERTVLVGYCCEKHSGYEEERSSRREEYSDSGYHTSSHRSHRHTSSRRDRRWNVLSSITLLSGRSRTLARFKFEHWVMYLYSFRARTSSAPPSQLTLLLVGHDRLMSASAPIWGILQHSCMFLTTTWMNDAPRYVLRAGLMLTIRSDATMETTLSKTQRSTTPRDPDLLQTTTMIRRSQLSGFVDGQFRIDLSAAYHTRHWNISSSKERWFYSLGGLCVILYLYLEGVRFLVILMYFF